MATAMLYQIPEPAYAAYIVFFLGRRDPAIPLLSGVAGAIAATFVDSRMNVPAEAALRAGYSDQPHLTRSLKAIMGITPGALVRGR